MHGQVVHAQYGSRSRYQPLQSKLCSGSEPLSIVSALLELYPFQTLYIADLDAIQNHGNHQAMIEAIDQKFPNLTIWLDYGKIRAPYPIAKIKPVLGSEYIQNMQDYLEQSAACLKRHVLSLDFNARGEMGFADLYKNAELWPDEVICMTLNKVGSEQGIDLKRLSTLKLFNKSSAIYAAGGVRNIDDIQRLKKLDIAGVLVATALHQKNITSSEIAAIYRQ
jgi:phosphoribosylformimino-5-aminoimidazole carboxamide ribotide isomerase